MNGTKKSVAEMLSEFLREAAVLTAVFLPMDRVVAQREDLTWGWLSITISISLFLFVVGVMVELKKYVFSRFDIGNPGRHPRGGRSVFCAS
jgi:hypothetical protein